MCIRDSGDDVRPRGRRPGAGAVRASRDRPRAVRRMGQPGPCLLYTSDAADERSSVDLGGSRIIKKKNKREQTESVGVKQSEECHK
mgnify:CR=1 FL=1